MAATSANKSALFFLPILAFPTSTTGTAALSDVSVACLATCLAACLEVAVVAAVVAEAAGFLAILVEAFATVEVTALPPEISSTNEFSDKSSDKLS